MIGIIEQAPRPLVHEDFAHLWPPEAATIVDRARMVADPTLDPRAGHPLAIEHGDTLIGKIWRTPPNETHTLMDTIVVQWH